MGVNLTGSARQLDGKILPTQADLVTAGSLSDTAKKEKVAAEVEARRTMLVHGDAFERDRRQYRQSAASLRRASYEGARR